MFFSSLGVLILSVAALLAAPVVAQAESGNLAFVGTSGHNLVVDANVTLTPNDCSADGYCGWFASATVEPAAIGCPSVYDQTATAVWSGNYESGPATDSEQFAIPDSDIAGSYDVCLYVSNPANSSDIGSLLASVPYQAPAPTATVSHVEVHGGQITGKLLVAETRCTGECEWHASATEHNGSSACNSSEGHVAWKGDDEFGLSAEQDDFSVLVPAAGPGVVCFYVTNDDPGETDLISTLPFTVAPDRSPTNLFPDLTSGAYKVTVSLTCPATKVRCSASISLRGSGRPVGSAQITIARGRTRTVVVRLNGLGRRLDRQSFGLPIKVTITGRDSYGDPYTRSQMIAVYL